LQTHNAIQVSNWKENSCKCTTFFSYWRQDRHLVKLALPIKLYLLPKTSLRMSSSQRNTDHYIITRKILLQHRMVTKITILKILLNTQDLSLCTAAFLRYDIPSKMF
jgi:hypothetical protein